MKESIYDLIPLATPGEAVAIHGEGTCFHEGNLDSIQRLSNVAGDEECWETIAEFWPADKEERAEADAKMYAHCRNKFMMAVSELKEAKNELEDLYFFAINHGIAEAGDPPHERLKRKIKQLETL